MTKGNDSPLMLIVVMVIAAMVFYPLYVYFTGGDPFSEENILYAAGFMIFALVVGAGLYYAGQPKMTAEERHLEERLDVIETKEDKIEKELKSLDTDEPFKR